MFSGLGAKQWYLYTMGAYRNRFDIEPPRDDVGNADIKRLVVEEEINNGTFGKDSQAQQVADTDKAKTDEKKLANEAGEGGTEKVDKNQD